MKTPIALLFLLTSAAFCQNPTAPPHAPNGYPDRLYNRYGTSDRISVQNCIQQMQVTPGIASQQIGAKGVRVRATMTPLPTTGWHGHNEPGRPIAPVIAYAPTNPADPSQQLGYTYTDFTGCSNFTFKGPGYAGWYLVKFEYDPQPPGTQGLCGCMLTPMIFPPRGENYYLGELDWAESTAYKRNFSDILETFIVAPFSLHPGSEHGGKTRALTVLTRRKLAAAVMQWTSLGETPPDIMRASLPDGGVLDHVESFPSGGVPASGAWSPPGPEGHPNGVAFDIKRMSGKFSKLTTIMRELGCFTGAFAPNGTPVPVSWWESQTWWHYVCDTSPIKTP